MSNPTIQNIPSEKGEKAPAGPQPPKKGRGRKPGQEPKVRPDIPMEEFVIHELSGKKKADLRRKREPRGEQQEMVDTIVWEVFQENKENGYDRGTVRDWADLAVYDWAVSKTHAETAEFRVQKAGTLYTRQIIFGEKVEVPASERHDIPDPDDPDTKIACHLNGKEHVHIPFSVVRKRRRPVPAQV